MSPRASAPRQRLASSPRRRRPLISLTPLIDVVFILLVFFMLASSFLDWRGIALSVPAVAASGTATEDFLLIEVRADEIRLSGDAVTLDALEERLRALLAKAPEQSVVVRPAAGVSLQRAVEVLDRAARAGAEISLVGGAGS